MFKLPSFGKLETEVTMETSHGGVEPDTPFRILFLGDFSGRANRKRLQSGSGPVDLRVIQVDRDNFNEAMTNLDVRLSLSIAEGDAPQVEFRFKSLDDFHPDRIFDRLEIFQALKQMRKGLNEPSTFAAAAAQVRSWTGTEDATFSGEPPGLAGAAAPTLAEPATGSLLDQMLEAAQERAQTATPRPDEQLQMLLREIVKPHLVPTEDPQRAELVSCVDSAIGELMRAILHNEDFQSLESVWRGLYFLASRLETGVELKLYLLDASKAELADDLFSSEDLGSTAIYKVLVEEAVGVPGGEPWAVVIGNYSFDRTREDAETLGRMARIARRAVAPFIAAASARALGCESLAETPDPRDWKPSNPVDNQEWIMLRQMPEAACLGLVLPRFLLRLPYGEQSDPVEQFDFEEMPAGSRHEDYLWGNPAFACAYLLGLAFNDYGWDFRPGVFQDIDGLPMHIYKEDGESRVKPCAETLMTERAAEAILNSGIMPLLSFRGRDSIRLGRFQSIADPLAALEGLWSS